MRSETLRSEEELKAAEEAEKKLEKEEDGKEAKRFGGMEAVEKKSIVEGMLEEERHFSDYFEFVDSTDFKITNEEKFKKEILSELPEVAHKNTQEIINEILEKNKDKKELPKHFGMISSFLINKEVGKYVEEERNKGKQEEEIEDLVFYFDLKSFEDSQSKYLGYKNPEKSHLIIDGNVGSNLGEKNEGKIEVNGNTGSGGGIWMKRGEIEINGDVNGFVVGNGGFEKGGMEGGRININGNVGDVSIGRNMRDVMIEGEINIGGNAKKCWSRKMKEGV